MLKAIKLARRRLVQGALAGAGGEGRGQLPKYVVVVSATDVENPGRDDIAWGDDPTDVEEDWETFASNFTKVRPPTSLGSCSAPLVDYSLISFLPVVPPLQGPHCTTLFSLISLGSTPNLEAFWKKVSRSRARNSMQC